MNPSQVIDKIKGLFSNTKVLTKPTFPEFTFIPDMAIKKDDRLIIVEIVDIKLHEDIDATTLRLLEFLFEAKLTLGNRTVFNLFINNKDLLKPYCVELLENLFDKVYYYNPLESITEINIIAKNRHFELWDLEREYVRSRYDTILNIDPSKYTLAELNHRDIEEKIRTVLQPTNLEITTNAPIRNLKNDYITGEQNLRFYFDYKIDNALIELKTFKRISNTEIQNLLIKARLARYSKEGGFLHLIPTRRKMILIINGKIDGPSYDKSRFIKMLIGAGWQLHPVSILEHNREFINLIRND
jgi:hypothetical protein